MAKPSTTHVIEIETGIGEPAFIPLTMGQELQPISVGKKGMWRIESARVLDVHAFVYFDGTSLFLQSADESASASVDGYRVGKAWTELHAPCKIEIGAARLRFRSLMAGAVQEEPATARQAQMTGPVMAIQAVPSPPRPGGAGVGDAPMTFPKADRPFKPGEFAGSSPQGESTRVKPLDSGGSGQQRPAQGSGSNPVSSAPRPAAGRPADDNTRAEGSGNLSRTAGMPIVEGAGAPQTETGPQMVQGVQAVQALPSGALPMMMMQQHHQMHPTQQNYGQQQQQQQQQYGNANNSGSGPYNAMNGGNPNPSGGYGSMTGGQFGGPPPAEGSVPYYAAKYRELSPPKRILVILAPFCLVAAGYLLLFDDVPPMDAGPGPQMIDAGAAAQTAPTQPTTPVQPTQPTMLPQPSCPPNFVPYTIPINGQIPCVPVGTPMPAPDAGAAPQPTPPQPQPPPTPPQPTPPQPPPQPPQPASAQAATQKTLERQAVDAVAVNDYARAAAIYEELQRQNPTNRVYAEAARILRQKADAGTY